MTKDGGRLAGRTVATAGACNTTVGTGDAGAAGGAKAEAEAARQRLRAERGWLTAAHTVAIVGGGIGGLATALALQQAGPWTLNSFIGSWLSGVIGKRCVRACSANPL